MKHIMFRIVDLFNEGNGRCIHLHPGFTTEESLRRFVEVVDVKSTTQSSAPWGDRIVTYISIFYEGDLKERLQRNLAETSFSSKTQYLLTKKFGIRNLHDLCKLSEEEYVQKFDKRIRNQIKKVLKENNLNIGLPLQ